MSTMNAQQLAQQLFSPETAEFVRGAAEVGTAAYDMMTSATVALIDELRWMSDDDDGSLFGTTYSETDAAASVLDLVELEPSTPSSDNYNYYGGGGGEDVTSQAASAGSSNRQQQPRPPPPPSQSPPPPSNPPPLLYDFASTGPMRVTSYEVSFYWPGVGFDFAAMTLPWITATVFKPKLPQQLEDQEDEADDDMRRTSSSSSSGGGGGGGGAWNSRRSSASKPKFPVIAFGIGWNSWTERYARTLTELASHGFIVVAPSVADRVVLPTSFSALAGNLRACLEWAATEGRRSRSPLYGLVDRSRMGLFGHSSGAGAAARAAIDMKNGGGAFGNSLKALAGLGIFSPATRLDVEELRGLRDVAVLQMAGQRDLHTTPRAVATAVEAMRYATPRATAVIRRGTHCWLDEAASYVYPVGRTAIPTAGSLTTIKCFAY